MIGFDQQAPISFAPGQLQEVGDYGPANARGPVCLVYRNSGYAAAVVLQGDQRPGGNQVAVKLSDHE